jgi:hypothetical protein
MKLKAFVLLAVTVAISAVALAQDASCKDGKVEYSNPTEHILKQITLSSDPVPFPKEMKQDSSPSETRWMITVSPDYRKPGPWNTTLIIGDRSTGEPFLKAEFRDHGNAFTARWLNEKLIFIEVWWGRIAASDLILDVENKKFIYNQLAHYGEITFCKEP